ncbi:class I SAM-dependent methyltransferase [Hymenobacter arizonensis]|uniref:Methyltransferase domain-containing protein n=1 Tax=Hymenobacter arizonensis TaxID=1227077 RepID=A0A1I6BST3_HYMAR|nr:class I SAM-dependent methyltransferase [Hymenobacter arizonensis]SFQ83973.1 Methyltransferase domain-containing protein [Hymenobacter arizonensis]
MDLNYEAKYHQLEEQHWWFASRRDAVYDLIAGLQLPKTTAILEIGCSGGPLMQRLRGAGYTDLTGIDVSESAIELAQARGVPNVSVMDGASLTFPDARFDLVIASDVLEHIENEGRALSEWTRVLKSGGKLLIFVPAHAYLWSEHDVVNHHFRRYSRQRLVSAMESAGVKVQRSSFWNALMFFPTSALRLGRRLISGPVSSEKKPGATGDLRHFAGPANKLLLQWVKAKNRLLRHFNLPLGMSVFALAQKPA